MQHGIVDARTARVHRRPDKIKRLELIHLKTLDIPYKLVVQGEHVSRNYESTVVQRRDGDRYRNRPTDGCQYLHEIP